MARETSLRTLQVKTWNRDEFTNFQLFFLTTKKPLRGSSDLAGGGIPSS